MRRLYVPILKWKRGEQTALETLSPQVKAKLTPVLEIPPIDFDYDKNILKKSLDQHVSNIGAILRKVWEPEYPFFIDLCSFSKGNATLQNGDHPMKYIMDDFRSKRLIAIPVTGYDRDQSYQIEVKDALTTDRSGVCFRIKNNDFTDLPGRVGFLLNILSVTPEEVDVIIDFEHILPGEESKNLIAAKYVLDNLPHLSRWRSLTLCATSFPETLPAVAIAGNIQNIVRSEKILWNLLKNSDLKRLPDYGDYAIANPKIFDMNPRLMTVSANIRYTGTNDFIVFKGKAIKKNGWAQIIPMTQELIKHKEYCGKQFSAGDKFIWDVAHRLLKKKNGGDTTGNSETWRTVGTNHHITFVVNEISNSTFP